MGNWKWIWHCRNVCKLLWATSNPKFFQFQAQLTSPGHPLQEPLYYSWQSSSMMWDASLQLKIWSPAWSTGPSMIRLAWHLTSWHLTTIPWVPMNLIIELHLLPSMCHTLAPLSALICIFPLLGTSCSSLRYVYSFPGISLACLHSNMIY